MTAVTIPKNNWAFFFHSTDSPPRFTKEQEKAMSHCFNQSFGKRKVKEWNRISDLDPIWEACVEILISDYGLLTSSSTTKGIAQKAIQILSYQLRKGSLKRFFCEHVLTHPDQIQDRLYRFIKKLSLNQDAQYFCLIPSNSYCIIECNLFSQFTLFPLTLKSKYYSLNSMQLKGRVQHVKELDLLLDTTFAEEISDSNPLVKNDSDNALFKAQCELAAVLPPSREDVMSRLESSMQCAFSEKVSEGQRKKWIYSATLVTALAIGVIYFVKPYRLSEWMDALARRLTRS